MYDEENIVAILDQNKELLATIIHDSNTDTPLSITTHQNEAKALDDYEKYKLYTNLSEEEKLHIYQGRQKRTYYYHRDHQGSITALTDEEGNIVESFLYDDAYGTILDHHKTVETYNPYCYTGREFDTQDLYYYRARYYDPTVGRFISSDPIEFLAGDVNFYRYVGNDPINYIDAFGYKRCSKNKKKKINDKVKNATKKLNKLEVKLGKKVAKSAARKAAAVVMVVADGPLPIGDIVAAGTMIYDIWDMWGSGDAVADALEELADAMGEAKECEKKEKEAKKKEGEKVKAEEKKLKKRCGKNYKPLRRPYIRKPIRQAVEDSADKLPDGRFLDAVTDEVIDGKYDLGHEDGAEFWREKELAERKCMSQKDFNNHMNKKEKYRIEHPKNNRSHKNEDKTPLPPINE